jgi:hypothetical protein
MHFIDGGHGKVALMGMHTLLTQVLILLLLKKWISSTMSKTAEAEFGKKNTRNFRG